MNIAIDIRSLLTKPRTGVGEYVFALLSALFKNDKTNRYFLYYNSFKKELSIPEWSTENVTFVRTRYPNKIFNLCIAFFQHPLLDKIIEKKIKAKIDVFYSPHINFTALSRKTNFVLTVHDLSFEYYPYFFSLRQRLWHQLTAPKKQMIRANLIFTPSESTKNDVINFGIAQEKVHCVYPGLNPLFKDICSDEKVAEVKNKYNLNKKYILFLGTLEPRKNLTALISAFEMLERSTDIDLVIAGGHGFQYQKLLKRIITSRSTSQIKLLDYVPEIDKPALYRGAEIFVYPSFYEGFGFPILEALSQNTMTITSHRGSLPEIGMDKIFYIEPHHPETITRAIKLAIKQKTALNAEELKNKFDWDKTAKNFLDRINPTK